MEKTECIILKTANRMLILKIWILNVLISMKHIGDDKHHRMGRVCVCVGEGG